MVQSGQERRLYLNEGYAIHSVWRPDTVLTGGEWDMFLTAPPLLGRPAPRVATLGNAAGTTARAYGVYYPEARIDGVELDPAVTAVGRRWFGLGDNPRLTVHTADARPFLAATDARYDLILIDAYRQPYVPFYLATREFFRLCRQRLAPGGIVALNVSTVPGDDRLATAVAGTLRAEFPQVVTWQALRFNQFVVGLTKPLPRAVMTRPPDAAPRDLLPLTRLFARDLREASPAGRPWTDDRAPVEWVTDRMIASYALRGADDSGAPPAHGARLTRTQTASLQGPIHGFSGHPLTETIGAHAVGAMTAARPTDSRGGAYGGQAAVPRRLRGHDRRQSVS